MLLTQCSDLDSLDWTALFGSQRLPRGLVGMAKPLPGEGHSSPELETPSGASRQWDRGRPGQQLSSPEPRSPVQGSPANLAHLLLSFAFLPGSVWALELYTLGCETQLSLYPAMLPGVNGSSLCASVSTSRAAHKSLYLIALVDCVLKT